MITNLFTKVFLVIENNIEFKDHIVRMSVDDCIVLDKNKDNMAQTFSNLAIKLTDMNNTMPISSFRFFTVKNEENYYQIIKSYLYYLNLLDQYKDIIESWKSHDDLFCSVWSMAGINYTPVFTLPLYLIKRFEGEIDCLKSIPRFHDVMYKIIQEDLIDYDETILKTIPAEYMAFDYVCHITDLDNGYNSKFCTIGWDKYKSFIKYDIGQYLLKATITLSSMGLLEKYENQWNNTISIYFHSLHEYCFNMHNMVNIIDIKNAYIKSINDNKHLYDKTQLDTQTILSNAAELESSLKTILVSLLKESDIKDFNNAVKLIVGDFNPKEYLDVMNTTMGYSAMGLFKYNKSLANKIRSLSYSCQLFGLYLEEDE